MRWPNVASSLKILIYTFISVLGLMSGIVFLIYFSLKFNLLFMVIGFAYFLIGMGSTIYLEKLVKENE